MAAGSNIATALGPGLPVQGYVPQGGTTYYTFQVRFVPIGFTSLWGFFF